MPNTVHLFLSQFPGRKSLASKRLILPLGLLMSLVFVLSATAQTEEPGNILTRQIVGVQKVLFIRLEYPDDNEIILSDQRAPVHANALREIIRTNSYNKLNFDIDVTPVLMMPQATTFYQLENRLSFVRIRADAIKIAEDAGFNESAYDREAIFTKKLWSLEAQNIAGFNFRTVFLSSDSPLTTSHEFGHTFGWRHASFWRSAGADPISNEGTLVEYGDRFDIMGNVEKFHHYNPWLKYRAGWIPQESILAVSQSGTYIVRALEKQPLTDPQVDEYMALQIRRNPESEYWLFYRSQEEMANSGAIITQVRPSNTSRTLLLDMTPGSKLLNRDAEDAALAVGKTIRDQAAGIEIKLLAKNNDSLAVQVVVPDTTFDRLPVLDIIRPSLGKTVQGAVDYEATAFDPDVGNGNGAGIDTVKFVLGYDAGTDPNGNDNLFVQQGEKLLTAPPYIFHVETDSLPDEAYKLNVVAISKNGGTNRATLRHIIDNSGPSVSTSVEEGNGKIVKVFRLYQNYPNPFNPSTTIHYSLARAGMVELNLYDLIGRKVRTLVMEKKPAGEYVVQWDGRNEQGLSVVSGSYFYQLRVGNDKATKFMILTK